MSIQCAYLPHMTPRSTGATGPRSRPLSPTTMTHAQQRLLSPKPSANSRWDAHTTEHGLALGRKLCLARSRSQPRDKLCLVRARPRPPSPVNPAVGHSFSCSPHDRKPQRRLDHDLKKTSTSPERGFDLGNTDERTPNVIRSHRADVGYPTYY
jgi:hypothetical protein